MVLLLAAGLLVACTTGAQRTGASAPTVTYSYQNNEQFRAAAEAADDYCEEHYDSDARVLDLWVTNGQATFTCIPD